MNAKMLGILALAGLANICCGTMARADLANCLILRGASSHLEGEEYEQISKSIYDAYASSDDSAGDIVFLLDIAGSKPVGSYEIQRISLALTDFWTLKGYKIAAPDIAGMKNGAAELIKAFKAGRIYHLKQGGRDRAVAAPLYEQ